MTKKHECETCACESMDEVIFFEFCVGCLPYGGFTDNWQPKEKDDGHATDRG